VWLLAAALVVTACGQGPGTDQGHPSAAIQKAAVARQAVAAGEIEVSPGIINPLEEVLAFDPHGILRWTEVPGADAYEVWAYDYGQTQVVESSGSLPSRQYQFTRLMAGSQYEVTIYARINGNWTGGHVYVYLETAANVTKPRLSNAQEEIEAFAVGGTLRWAPVAGADSYEVWIYHDRALRALAETSGPLSDTQYPLRALPAGKTYFAQVYGRVNGEFQAGGALALTVVAESSRARLVNPQQELDAFASGGLLRWSAVPGATAYEVWIYTNPHASDIYESSGNLTTRMYAPRTLRPGGTYYVQIFTWVNGDWQAGSPVKITTAAQVAVARLTNPQEELEAFATNGTLAWNEVPGADRYEVWIFGNAGLGVVAEAGFPAGRSYRVTRLCSGGRYYMQLYARVNGQWMSGSATRLDVTQGESPANCVPPAPMVTFTANPIEPRAGESVTLTWTSRFASSCAASGDWSGARPTSGTETLGPLTTASRFTLACDGPSGTTYVPLSVIIALPKYTAVLLRVGTTARALNEFGDFSGATLVRTNIGGSGYAKYPFAYINGQFNPGFPTPLPPGVALDINSRRQVVIGEEIAPFSDRGGHLFSEGVLHPLPELTPQGVNDLGHIVGASPGPAPVATLFRDGVLTSVPTPAGVGSVAYDINMQDVVVGDWWNPNDPMYRQHTQAFVYANGATTELGSLGGNSSHAEAINATGTIVGRASDANGQTHAVQWDQSGIADLGTLGCGPSHALGINAAGQIVGDSCTFRRADHPSSGLSAFLFAYGMMYDLNDHLARPLIATEGLQGTIWLRQAFDINDRGQILVDGCVYGYPTDCRAILLTPAE